MRKSFKTQTPKKSGTVPNVLTKMKKSQPVKNVKMKLTKMMMKSRPKSSIWKTSMIVTTVARDGGT